MKRLAFSKASLHHESAQLKRYRQYLPSLDLKRQQLAGQRAKAVARLSKTQQAIDKLRQDIGELLPMLANRSIDLTDLAQIVKIELGKENVVGVHLPILDKLEIKVKNYSYLAKPHWVDQVVIQLKKMLELKIRQQIETQRVEILELAVKKVTQRVNLFDKVLIPQARENIRKISIFLSDTERAGVVRAKITKRKRLSTRLK